MLELLLFALFAASVELMIEWFCGADDLGVTPKIASTQGNDGDDDRVGHDDNNDMMVMMIITYIIDDHVY